MAPPRDVERGGRPQPPPGPAPPAPTPPPAGGAQPPAPAAAAPQGYQGERRDDSTVGEKDWDPGWEKRVRKMFPDEKGDLNDPKYRDYLNKKMRGERQKAKAPAGGGGEVPPEEAPPEAPPGGTAEEPPTGGVDPGPGAPSGPVNPQGGWMPNRAPLPWGGGGRTNWGQGPAQGQGYPGGGAGYPGAPNYPLPGQGSPLPGQPGGPVRGTPGQPNPTTFPGPGPPGHGFPRMPPGPGQTGPFDPRGPGGSLPPRGGGGFPRGPEQWPGQRSGATGGFVPPDHPSQQGGGGQFPQMPPPGRGYPRWPGGPGQQGPGQWPPGGGGLEQYRNTDWQNQPQSYQQVDPNQAAQAMRRG